MYRIIIIFAVLFLGLGSCKSKKDLQDGGKLRKRSATYILDKMDKHFIDAEWVNSKASIKLIQANSTLKASVYLRMRKDSVIWASVRKLGIEVGRLLVTTDSVFLLNKLNKTYEARSFEHLQKIVGLTSSGDKIQDFRNIYNILLGNPIFLSDKKMDVSIKKTNYILEQKDNNLQANYTVTGKKFQLNKMIFLDLISAREASCSYEGYKELENHYLFSYIRKLKLFSRETGHLEAELNFSKVVLNQPTQFKFDIPSSYEKID